MIDYRSMLLCAMDGKMVEDRTRQISKKKFLSIFSEIKGSHEFMMI